MPPGLQHRQQRRLLPRQLPNDREGKDLPLQPFPKLGIIFPQDYLAFMEIHNGFAKINDVGILEAKDVYPTYEELERAAHDGASLS